MLYWNSRFFLLTSFFILSLVASSQKKCCCSEHIGYGKPCIPCKIPYDGMQVHKVADEMPVFPGGEAGMYNYLEKNIIYPEEEKKIGIEGTVYLSFVVTTTGQIKYVELLRGVVNANALSQEAIRVVQSMPLWKPGKQGGKEVNVKLDVPIKFSLGN